MRFKIKLGLFLITAAGAGIVVSILLKSPSETAFETAVSAAPRPRIVVDDPIIDIGKVSLGTTGTSVFRVRNAGLTPAKVELWFRT